MIMIGYEKEIMPMYNKIQEIVPSYVKEMIGEFEAISANDVNNYIIIDNLKDVVEISKFIYETQSYYIEVDGKRISIDEKNKNTIEYFKKLILVELQKIQDKVLTIKKCENSSREVNTYLDGVINDKVKDNPCLTLENFKMYDSIRGASLYGDILRYFSLNRIGITKELIIDKKSYIFYDVNDEGFREVSSKFILAREKELQDDLQLIHDCDEERKNLQVLAGQKYESLKDETDLFTEMNYSEKDFTRTVISLIYLKHTNSTKNTFTMYDYSKLDLSDEEVDEYMNKYSAQLMVSLENQKTFIVKDSKSKIDLREFANKKVESIKSRDDRPYNISAEDCVKSIQKDIAAKIENREYIPIKHEIINGELYFHIDLDKKEVESFILERIEEYYTLQVQKEAHSTSTDIISFRLLKAFKSIAKSLLRDRFYFTGTTLYLDLYLEIRDGVQASPVYSKFFDEECQFKCDDIELQELFKNYVSLDKALVSHEKTNVLVSDTYMGENLKNNCLVANQKYDIAYIYFNYLGAVVLRKNGKYCVKVSRDAQIEEKLKPSEIQERLNYTYSFDDRFNDTARFNEKNTINYTTEKFLPEAKADYVIDSITRETVKNICEDITEIKNIANNSIVVTQNYLLELCSDNHEDYNAFMDNLAFRYQKGIAPKVKIVLNGLDGLGAEILNRSILEPLFIKEQSTTIKGNKLLEEVDGALSENFLVYISLIPTVVDTNNKQILEHNLDTLMNNSNPYNYVIVNSHELSHLKLNLNKNGIIVINANNLIQNFKCFEGKSIEQIKSELGQETDAVRSFLMTRIIDTDKVNKSLNNAAKDEALRTKNRYREFIKIIKQANLNYIKEFLELNDIELYDKVALGFKDKKPYIARALLADFYNALESPAVLMKTTGILKELRAIDEDFFDESKNATDKNNTCRFQINSQYNDMYN